jgi:hypothetical protein
VTGSGDWNEDLICQVFPIDAQYENWWAWELEKHGNYSVKSSYPKLYAMNGRGEEEMPSGSGAKTWKRVWKLHVPVEVRKIWW